MGGSRLPVPPPNGMGPNRCGCGCQSPPNGMGQDPQPGKPTKIKGKPTKSRRKAREKQRKTKGKPRKTKGKPRKTIGKPMKTNGKPRKGKGKPLKTKENKSKPKENQWNFMVYPDITQLGGPDIPMFDILHSHKHEYSDVQRRI